MNQIKADQAKAELGLIEALGARSRTFLKLDLAYLFAAITAVTAVQWGDGGLMVAGDSLAPVFLAWAVLALFDVTLESNLLDQWLHIYDEGRAGPWLSLSRGMIRMQVWLHFLFVVMSLTGFVAFSRGYRHEARRVESISNIHNCIVNYAAENGHVPKSLGEAAARFRLVNIAINELGDEPISYRPTGEKSFELRLAGDDKRLRTADDDIYTQDRAPATPED